jgi:hypothetical protein
LDTEFVTEKILVVGGRGFGHGSEHKENGEQQLQELQHVEENVQKQL